MRPYRPIAFVLALVLAAALGGGSPALAATVGIGTTKGGAVNQAATVISNVVSAHTDIQMRPQPMGGNQQFVPLVNTGKLEFGLASTMETYWSMTGTGIATGEAPNLRMVARLFTFETGVVVRGDSDIRKLDDIRGKRIGHGFPSAPLFQAFYEGYLANAGLGWNDVQAVPMVGLAPHWDAFKRGDLDFVNVPIGAAIVKQLQASVPGGIRFLSFDKSPARAQAMLAYLPRTTIVTKQPSPAIPGATAPVNVLSFDYMLWAGKDVSDGVVATVAKAVHDHARELIDSSPVWRTFHANGMYHEVGMPYHPGAVEAYKAIGLKMD